MFGQNLEQSIYDAQQSIQVLQTLKDNIQAYQDVLRVEDVLSLIDQQIHDTNRRKRALLLAKKLDMHLPDTAKAPLTNT
ncbi:MULTISPECIES: hypothetical protein [Methylobacillus]|uniref:Uncharacterized protein n=1 Tax=Methylobacillus flagellatus (strain ATCC 51484 / DSM 6875 / VKM B-1610 / KT) TaxID=265072 RepID=Q1H3Y1_METFK|nr:MULTISPECIES: hypothetical protein [Methylobacillus]ABE48806.1 hypothetical protein Mfla_0536 [Methylobacillus flagellatus KT]MPS49458.1 hypothetical protein [Methylobacillus sp.]